MSPYPLELIDPAWKARDFARLELVAPGDPLPDLGGYPVVAFDVETQPREGHEGFDSAALDPWRGQVFGLSVAVPDGGGAAWYLPLRHRAVGSEHFNLMPGVDAARIGAWLQFILGTARLIVNHNVKFDLRFCATSFGLDVTALAAGGARFFDTMLAAHLADEREPVGFGLKPLSDKYLNLPASEQAAVKQYLAGQKKDYQDWSLVPVDVMAPYAVGDVERTLRLAAHYAPLLSAQQVVAPFVAEMDLLPVLAAAELRGVPVDVPALEVDQIKLTLQELTAHQQLEAAFGGASVNPNSGDELSDAFITKLQIPILVREEPKLDKAGKEKPGTPEFDDAALERYRREYPQFTEVFWRIQQARRLYHCRGSFVEPMLHLHDGGTLHYEYKQLSPRTGTRMSCENFNVQFLGDDEQWNDPLTAYESDEDNGDGSPEIKYAAQWLAPGGKKFICARPGMALVFLDYSQIEYRIFAHYANSEALVTAFNENPKLDMHKWAAEVVLEGLLPRDDAKHIHFGIVYGMGDGKLMKKLSLGEADARRMLANYRSKVPELEQLKARVKTALLDRGFVKTLGGRKRRLETNPAYFRFGSDRPTEKPKGILPYQGLNAICQGSAGDLLKDRVPVGDAIARRHGGQLLFLVHDEFVFELPQANVVAAVPELRAALTTWEDENGTPRLRVPIYVDCRVSTTTWAKAEDYHV